MDALYDNLLEYYDEIFPVDQERIVFLEDAIRKGKKLFSGKNGALKVLDVGCATGSTSLVLMRRGFDVTGIDLNAAMIQSACRRNPEPKTNARFFRMDMLDVADTFAEETFDALLCLGNTLVHLDGAGEIGDFLDQAKQVLRPGGTIVLQTVNYGRVLEEGLTHLPTIETARARFVRNYTRTEDGRIFFDATIFSSSDQPVYRDRVLLYPATPDELSSLLKGAGFKKIELYDDFTGDPLKGKTLGLVAVASA